MPVVPFSAATRSKASPSASPPAEPFALMAAAQMHAEGRLVEPPLDITSSAQKADLQKKANSWPEGTAPEVQNTMNKLLRDGTISRDQYNRVMRDPRQFQTGDQ